MRFVAAGDRREAQAEETPAQRAESRGQRRTETDQVQRGGGRGGLEQVRGEREGGLEGRSSMEEFEVSGRHRRGTGRYFSSTLSMVYKKRLKI